MSWKDDYITENGERAYIERLRHNRKWQIENSEKVKIRRRKSRTVNSKEENLKLKKWREANPQKVKQHQRELCRKGGKRYEAALKYHRTGLQGKRSVVRAKHRKQWRNYKQIIAPNSELHHQWILDTAKYTGVALVESNPHRYGIIDVIQILDGNITLLEEKKTE